MLEWDSRMQNNHSIKVLKAAIPFFDVAIGETIDLEGLFHAIRPFIHGWERRILDMLLQFFQMRHMMEMLQVVQAMQAMQAAYNNSADQDGQPEGGGMEGMFDMLRDTLPPGQQDVIDMAKAMMSMMPMGQQEGENEPVDI
ncbi:MAG: hypothetical protein J1F02_08810 [Lachnospiraceae bacterium]|nr:hypothetical protein [Lachnospiraceae bacterium]